MTTLTETLDRLLDPLGRALTPEVARRIVALRADPQVQARVDYLADRCNEGLLTPEERTKYEALIAAAEFIVDAAGEGQDSSDGKHERVNGRTTSFARALASSGLLQPGGPPSASWQ